MNLLYKILLMIGAAVLLLAQHPAFAALDKSLGAENWSYSKETSTTGGNTLCYGTQSSPDGTEVIFFRDGSRYYIYLLLAGKPLKQDAKYSLLLRSSNNEQKIEGIAASSSTIIIPSLSSILVNDPSSIEVLSDVFEVRILEIADAANMLNLCVNGQDFITDEGRAYEEATGDNITELLAIEPAASGGGTTNPLRNEETVTTAQIVEVDAEEIGIVESSPAKEPSTDADLEDEKQIIPDFEESSVVKTLPPKANVPEISADILTVESILEFSGKSEGFNTSEIDPDNVVLFPTIEELPETAEQVEATENQQLDQDDNLDSTVNSTIEEITKTRETEPDISESMALEIKRTEKLQSDGSLPDIPEEKAKQDITSRTSGENADINEQVGAKPSKSFASEVNNSVLTNRPQKDTETLLNFAGDPKPKVYEKIKNTEKDFLRSQYLTEAINSDMAPLPKVSLQEEANKDDTSSGRDLAEKLEKARMTEVAKDNDKEDSLIESLVRKLELLEREKEELRRKAISCQNGPLYEISKSSDFLSDR